MSGRRRKRLEQKAARLRGFHYPAFSERCSPFSRTVVIRKAWGLGTIASSDTCLAESGSAEFSTAGAMVGTGVSVRLGFAIGGLGPSDWVLAARG